MKRDRRDETVEIQRHQRRHRFRTLLVRKKRRIYKDCLRYIVRQGLAGETVDDHIYVLPYFLSYHVA